MGNNFLNNFVTVFWALLDLSTNGKTFMLIFMKICKFVQK